MQGLNRASLATAAAAFALTFVATPIAAQECTAELSPSEIESGAAAVELSVTLSQPVGAVSGLQADPESGIAVASPSDVPRTDLAAEEQPQPIEMGESEDSWTVWLNTTAASPGVYRVAFTGTAGQCEGEIIVN